MKHWTIQLEECIESGGSKQREVMEEALDICRHLYGNDEGKYPKQVTI